MPRLAKMPRNTHIQQNSGLHHHGGARNEIKLKTLDLFQYGIEGSDIPEYTLNQTLKGDFQYIDTYLADLYDVINTTKLGISGVIDIFHKRKVYPVDTPYTYKTFNGNTSHFRDGKYWIDDYHGEVQDKLSFSHFRDSMLKDIRTAPAHHGTKKLYTLANWLAEKSIAFPYNNMAQKRYGYLELLPGYYLRCAHCKCTTYLPLSTLLPPTVTKAQLTQFLRDFRDKQAEFMPDGEIYGEMAMMIPMCFASSNGQCFNCNNDLFTDTIRLSHAIYPETVAYINTLRGTHLEELTKLNMLQGAPPDDMPLAKNKFNQLHNRHAARAIAKMNQLYLNTLYELNPSIRTAELEARNHLRLSNTARINSTSMSNFEAEEILLIADLISATHGNILAHPTTPVVAASLQNLCPIICNTPYFTDVGLVVDINTQNDYSIEILPAQYDMDTILKAINEHAYLILPRPDIDKPFIHQDANWYYATPTDGEVLIKWNKTAVDMLANASKLQVGEQYYNINTVSVGQYMQILSFSHADHSLHLRTITSLPMFRALVPVYDFDSPLSTLGVFGNKWEYKNIDVELLRRLVTFALTADKSVTTMEAYFAGIISTHYTIGGKVVDLTNTPITEGLPELIYAMMILSNRKLTTAWATYLNLTNYSTFNSLQLMLQFVVGRILRTVVHMADKLTPWFNQVLSKPTEFMKKLVNSNKQLDVESVFDRLLPIHIIDGIYSPTDMIASLYKPPSTHICNHHASCAHKVGDLRCLCCGIISDQSICSCCIKFTKCAHKCDHACNKSYHYCESCHRNKPCHLQRTCDCCGVYGCHPCVVCPKQETITITPAKPNIISNFVKSTANAAMGVPLVPNIVAKPQVPRTAKPTVNNATIPVGQQRAVFKPNTTTHTLYTDLLNCRQPSDLFIIDDEKLYIPLLSFTGKYHVAIQLPSEIVSDPVNTVDYCAYLCITKQSEYTKHAIINIFGDRPTLDLNDVRNLLKSLKLNALVIVSDSSAEIHRYGPQDLHYLLIMHGSISDHVPFNHWCIPHIPKFVDYPTGYYHVRNLGAPFEDIEHYNMWKAPAVEQSAFARKVQLLTGKSHKASNELKLPTVIDINGSKYLSNADHNDPRTGRIHVLLPSVIEDEMISALDGSVDKIIEASYANLTNDWENREQDVTQSLRLKCMEINKYIRNLNNPELAPEEYAKCLIDDDDMFINERLLSRVKPLDVVVLVQGEKRVVEVVAGEARMPVVRNVHGRNSYMFVFKSSLSSLYRGLMLGIKALINLENTGSMSIVQAIDGVAGSGKSTLISKLENRSQMTLICKTRSAVESHSMSGFNRCLTVEAAGMTPIITQTIVVDEASMITNVELTAMIDAPQMQVHLVGDTSQIGVKDMSDIKGIRDENNLLSQLCTKTITHTHRFGEPLVSKMLKQFYPSITCDTEKRTELTHLHANAIEEVITLARKYTPDAIYVFMNDHYVTLLDLLGNEFNVLKVHASQGREFNKVMVVHWGNFNIASSIVRSSKFIFTAATRAKDHLYWITPPEVGIQLSSLVDMTYIGSGIDYDGPFDPVACRLTRPLSIAEIVILTKLGETHPKHDPKVAKLTITPNYINYKTRHMFQEVDFTIDSKGIHGNNWTSNAFISTIRKEAASIFNAHFAKLEAEMLGQITRTNSVLFPHNDDNGDNDDVELNAEGKNVVSREPPPTTNLSNRDVGTTDLNSTQLSTTNSVESDEPGSESLLNFNADVVVKSLQLDRQVWSNLIVLADIILSAQATGNRTSFLCNDERFTIVIFNGCSLYCGFKFFNADGVVLISSAHAEDTRDGLLTTINAVNRHIFGTVSQLNNVLYFLTEELTSYGIPRSICVNTYMERISNICGGVVDTCSFESVGTRYGDRNKDIANRCPNFSSTWKVPTHQLVSHFITNIKGDEYTLEPSDIIITSQKGLFKFFTGIRGNDIEFELNKPNKATLERTLIRHMNSEEKFDRPVFAPHQYIASNYMRSTISQIGPNLIKSVYVGTRLMSSLHLCMLLGVNAIKTITNVERVHYVGLDAQLFCMNYNHGDTIDMVPPTDRYYIIHMLKAKVRDLVDKVDVESETRYNMTYTELVNYYSDINNIIRSKYDERNSIIMCHPRYFNSINLTNRYTVLPYTFDPSCTQVNGYFIEHDVNHKAFTFDTNSVINLMTIGNCSLYKNIKQRPDVLLGATSLINSSHRVFHSNIDKLNNITIPEPIYRRLYSRAFADKNTTITDMIAYSRSLLNTMTYTSKGYSYKYNDDPLQLLQYSVVVLNIANRQRKLTGFIDKVLRVESGVPGDYGLVDLFINMAKTIGVKLLQESLSEPLRMVNDFVNGTIKDTVIVNDIFNILKDVNFYEIEPVITVIHKVPSTEYAKLPSRFTDDELRSIQVIPQSVPTAPQHQPKKPENAQESQHTNTTDITYYPKQNMFGALADTNQLVANTISTVKSIWNKYINDSQLDLPEWEDRPEGGDVLLLYAGSRGDAQPLDAIAEVAVNYGLKVKALVPADIHKRLAGVEYVNYCESYDFLTNCGVNGIVPNGTDMVKFAFNVYRHWLAETNRHKYVIGMFFSSEARLVQGTVKNIRIIPQLDEHWDAEAKCKWADEGNIIRKLFRLQAPKITPYWSVPFMVRKNDDNLGFLIPNHSLTVDDQAILCQRFARKFDGKVTLVTLGSMIPDHYDTIITNMLNTTDQPTIFVLNKLFGKTGNYLFNGMPYTFKQTGIYERLCVVKTVNYLALKSYINTAVHHCGAGTYCTFRMMGVKQIPFPQAFDQQFNVYMCNKERDDGTCYNTDDISTQINESRHRIMKMLDINGPHVPIRLTETTINHSYPVVEPEIDHSCNMEKVVVKGIKPIHNQYVDDCVLLSILDQIDTSNPIYQTIETMYVNWTFYAIEDVIGFLLLVPVDAIIVGGVVSVRITRSAPQATVLVHITDDLRHAETFSYDEIIPIPSQLGGCLDEVIISEDFAQDIANLSEKLSSFKQPSPEKVTTNMVLTKLRKNDLLQLVTGTISKESFSTQSKLTPGYKYACIGKDGFFYAICAQATQNQYQLVHLSGLPLDVTVAIRLEKVFTINTAISRSLIKHTSLVAINHNTNKQLMNRGIYTSAVGTINADTLYIYDTWAREHHHEAEIEVIKTASRVMLVPAHPEEKLRQLPHPERVLCNPEIPTCINKGLIYFRFETNDTVTKTILSTIKATKQLTHSLYLLPYDTNLLIDVSTVFIYESPTVRFANVKEVDALKTMEDVLKLCNIENQQLIMRCKNIAMQFGYPSCEECPIETCPDPYLISDLSLAVRSKLLVLKDSFITSVNGLHLRIVPKGAGFSQFDVMNIPSLDDSKFNNNRFNVQHIESYVTPIVNDMTALLPLDHTSTTNDFIMRQDLSFHAKENQLISVGDVESFGLPVDSIRFDEIPMANVIDFWNNEELLDSNIILPTNPNFKVNSRIQPLRVKQNAYLLMEQYPKYARPSRSKAFAEELNSITNRHGAYTVFRRVDLDTQQEVQMLLDNYMRRDYSHLITQYKQQPITFDASKTQGWINKHNMPSMVIKDLQDMMLTGWEQTPINFMLVHGKTEQTTKLKSARWYDEVITRSIVAAPYAVSALFADIFLEAKQRLKALLSDKIFYSDGSTPIELGAVIRSSDEFMYCVEDDLTQQDRQVDHQLIKVEMELYKLLGVDGNVLEFYKRCHENWPWKGHGISGVWDAMRLSGQVTTALGNAITNLIVHNRFMLRNKSKISKMLFLGDDIIFLMNQQVNVAKHGTETKDLYNMQSKIISRKYVGGFLSMIVYNINGDTGICPHFKRMRHRFSVCNYTYPIDSTKDKVQSRVLSYLFMIGECDWTNALVKRMGFTVKLPRWYHQNTAILANALYDEVDEWVIHTHIGALRNMLEKQEVTRHKFMTWSSV